jgi:A/G-specific adenine glycosylase
VSKFASALIAWQKKHGRRELPWQGTRDPYRIWLSEVMLQQTQVAAVIPYYERFLRRFPTMELLAAASEDEVLQLWSGLGYYARGRNLHAAAKAVVAQGSFPRTAQEIEKLPGIGKSTAAAIAVFAFGERAAILDGNVKRVLARYFGIEGWPGEKAVETRLWAHAAKLLPKIGIEAYTQALMDLGATVCTRNAPRCEACPVRIACEARRSSRVAEVPAPRPRKALPHKTVTWLVLRGGDEILLEKRPSPGIWGGLWSFPEALARNIEEYCRRTLGCEVTAQKPLKTLEHGFTHFRLRIRPLLCEVTRKPILRTPGWQWIDLEEACAAAVPAPVRTLLGHVRKLPPGPAGPRNRVGALKGGSGTRRRICQRP